MEVKIRTTVILILLIVAALYANTLLSPFIWDDVTLIAENPYIKNINGLAKIFTSDLFHSSYEKTNYYRPIQSLTYMFDYTVWKLNPTGYHISNILLHGICAILIYLLLFFITKNNVLSLISTLLFTVSPLHTEAVTYISGRADSLAVIFLLSSLLFYIKPKEKNKAKTCYAISIACFVLALLSKEIAIILPFLIMLYDGYFTTEPAGIKAKIRRYSAYFLILLLYAFLRMSIFNFGYRPMLNTESDFILTLATSIKAVVIYIGLILFPFNLHMERTLPVAHSVLQPDIIISMLVIFLIIVFIINLRRRYKLVSFGSAWFLVSLIPVSGIFMPSKNVIMAEHWLYLPCIGFFIILGVVFGNLMKRHRKTIIVILSCLLSFYSYLAIKQNVVWRDPEAFYKRIIVFSPNNLKARFNLGVFYENKKDYDRALEEYEIALKIKPDHFLIHNHIGNIYSYKGLYDAAAEHYRQSLMSAPDYFLTHNNLGNLYMLRQEYNMAINEFKKSIQLNPSYGEAHNNLGALYTQVNNLDEAGREIKKALRINPENAEAYNNLGNLYLKKDLFDMAIEEFKRAIDLKSDLDKAHFNLGIAYFQKGWVDRAKEEWMRVLKINPGHQGALNNLKTLRDNESK